MSTQINTDPLANGGRFNADREIKKMICANLFHQRHLRAMFGINEHTDDTDPLANGGRFNADREIKKMICANLFHQRHLRAMFGINEHTD